jgi:hypothetical protein
MPGVKGPPGTSLALTLGVVGSVLLMYLFLVGLGQSWFPVAAKRSIVPQLLLYLAPIPILVGPMFAWRRRVEGATRAAAWRLAGATWLGGAGLYAASVATAYLGR